MVLTAGLTPLRYRAARFESIRERARGILRWMPAFWWR